MSFMEEESDATSEAMAFAYVLNGFDSNINIEETMELINTFFSACEEGITTEDLTELGKLVRYNTYTKTGPKTH